MNVVLLSRDLLLQSRADGAGRIVGLKLRIASDPETAVEMVCDEECQGIVIDLRVPKLDVGRLVGQIRSTREVELRIVACGPHVHEASLHAARVAGCDLVASRGQFDRDAEQILQSFIAADRV